MMEAETTVYLIHFLTPLKHARHYLGATTDLERRLQLHRKGWGSALMRAIKEAGIGWLVARTWNTSFEHERALKAQKNAPRLCPMCQEAQRRKQR